MGSRLSADKLYVSDEGGRQAQPGDTTMDSYGTQVPANGYLGTSTTGEVSVIDTSDPSAAVGSIAVGLHPTAMYADGNALFVANTNSDTVSVINTNDGPGRADDRDQAVAGVRGGVRARQHRDDQDGHCWSRWGGRTRSRCTATTARRRTR